MGERAVRVRYHHEPEGWWAESPDIDGFVATGQTLAEVRELVHDGVPYYTEDDEAEILESTDKGTLVFEVHITTPGPSEATVRWTWGDLAGANTAQGEDVTLTPSRRTLTWA